jgi:hypothetical protein
MFSVLGIQQQQLFEVELNKVVIPHLLALLCTSLRSSSHAHRQKRAMAA